MPRFAAIEGGRVIGVFAAPAPPTVNVPTGRTFVDITEHPAIQGGESYDGQMFTRPAPVETTAAAWPEPDPLAERVRELEKKFVEDQT